MVLAARDNRNKSETFQLCRNVPIHIITDSQLALVVSAIETDLKSFDIIRSTSRLWCVPSKNEELSAPRTYYGMFSTSCHDFDFVSD